jgi:hypothetical protein
MTLDNVHYVEYRINLRCLSKQGPPVDPFFCPVRAMQSAFNAGMSVLLLGLVVGLAVFTLWAILGIG